MLPTGEDARIREKFRSLRTEEERGAPSFARVYAAAVSPRPSWRRAHAGWLVLASLALVVAAAATIAIWNGAAAVSGRGAGQAEREPTVAAPRVAEPDTAAEARGAEEVDALPVAENANRKAAKAGRAARRSRSAPSDSCATC